MGFPTEMKGEFHWVTAPESIDSTEIKLFDLVAKSWVESSKKGVILDFTKTTEIPSSFFRSIGILHNSLKSKNMQFCTFGLSEKIIAELKKQGMLETFNPIRNKAEIAAFLKK